jgi:hypothetical protein
MCHHGVQLVFTYQVNCFELNPRTTSTMGLPVRGRRQHGTYCLRSLLQC